MKMSRPLNALRALLLLCGLIFLPAALTTTQAVEYLDPTVAFQPAVRALDDRTLEVRFAIADGYYLYRDRFRFAAENITLSTPQLPAGKEKDDENFGKVEVFYKEVAIRLPVERNASGVLRFTLHVTSQGCAEAGLCYLPQTQDFTAELPAEGTAPVAPMTDTGSANGGASGASGDDSGFFAATLGQAGFWGKLSLFFVAGLGLAFTPCVFPMLPILSSLIVGHAEHGKRATVSKRRAFLLSLFYVLGMALTYAAAGVAAGLSGSLLSNALQNVWALSAFAGIFVLLAFAMFGFYTLQMPAALQSAFAACSRHFQGGHFFAVFVMGALSALIVGPCVAAPLAGALIYISTSGDAVLGGAALFVMALGMGVPLLAVGLSAGALLPRAGAWMEQVKKGFGVLLLATAVWLVSPVIPALAVMLAYASILLVAAIYLHALDSLSTDAGGWRRFWKGVGVVMLLWGAALFVGALAGSRDPLQPLAILQSGGGSAPSPLLFERVSDTAQLDARLQNANRPVMLDFYADWCVSCKEMERFTFSDPAVREQLAGFIRLQADVTANSDADKTLLQRFGLFGPPGIIFFDARGQEIQGLRVVGFLDAASFKAVLRRVDQRSGIRNQGSTANGLALKNGMTI
ncbi:thiol:disulfide interchange protein DsbD [Betaproteobacteria bacterium]|nr:thiol:disulfide interchange protein DsbD [Betaproteobacteria bacterium]GHU43544.1 thiol:disulfide interchange protein DsbD [Betaproteobacteria bacterium]